MTTTTVLLDLGGVLTTDPWESLLLSDDGLADRLGLPREELERAGQALWGSFSVSLRRADEYWDALTDALGLEPDALTPHLDGLEQRLLLHPRLGEIAAALTPYRVGVMSDNTAFFHPLQERLTDVVSALLDPDLLLLSHRLGLSKSHRPGMLEHASTLIEPSSTLFIDDRTHHIEHARTLDFRAHLLRDWSDAATDELLALLTAP